MKDAAEKLSASEGDGDLTITVGPIMDCGKPRWEFRFRSRADSCVQITCRQTDPEEVMHVCEPEEMLRVLAQAMAEARARDFAEEA